MAYLDKNGLAYFWQKAKQYIDNAVATGGGSSATAKTASLTAAGWALNSDGYYYQTASVSGVTSSSNVIVDTDNPSIKCTAQGSGTLTFRSINNIAATVKVLIFS